MRTRKYPRSVTVRMTNEMYANLRRLATDDRKVADVIRQMIRNQLDERAEISGNRRHFSARFQERIDELEDNLEMRMSLLTMLLTMFEEMVIQVAEVSAGQDGKLAYPSLFRGGSEQAAAYWQEIELAVDGLRDIMHDSGEGDNGGALIILEAQDDNGEEMEADDGA
jgi:hypothetical protein